MSRNRPLGVTILGIYFLIYSLIGLIIAFEILGVGGNYLTDPAGSDPLKPMLGLSIFLIGLIYLIIVISRFTIGIGLFRMSRGAWRGAFLILLISVFLDWIQGIMVGVILGLIALLYLILVKKYF